jgi:hypothetical protein
MTVYDLIGEARRENQTPAASRTLDMLVVELGKTRDNLRQAVGTLRERPLPEGGQRLLDRLLWRAEREGIDDLDYGPAPELPWERASEALDDATMGIGVLLGGTALLALALTVVVVAIGLLKIFHG